MSRKGETKNYLFSFLRGFEIMSETLFFGASEHFPNQEMEALVQLRPKSINELLNINGFGPKKAEKYGKDILAIINSDE